MSKMNINRGHRIRVLERQVAILQEQMKHAQGAIRNVAFHDDNMNVRLYNVFEGLIDIMALIHPEHEDVLLKMKPTPRNGAAPASTGGEAPPEAGHDIRPDHGQHQREDDDGTE